MCLGPIPTSALCTTVAAKWNENTWLLLLWLTPGHFTGTAQIYNNLLATKSAQGGGRPQLTGKLNALDKQINDSIDYIKGYLTDKYTKKTAPDYFAAFGIVRNGKKFIVPKDRNARSEALTLMLSGLEAEGFNNNKYGQFYWMDIKKNMTSTWTRPQQRTAGYPRKQGTRTR